MNATLLDRIIDPITACLTIESAKQIVEVRADAETQALADELAEKANLGILTSEERAAYDRLLATFHVITVIQARARRLLKA